MRLIVARHGTAFRDGEPKRYLGVSEDPSLSPLGIRQSVALARALRRRGVRPDVLTSGPQRRQQETAGVLARRFGAASWMSSPALSEIDYGPWEGRTREELLAEWPEESRAWKKSGVWPAGVFRGSFEETQERLRKWMKSLRGMGCGTVVAVTSQGTLRALFSIADPVGWKKACAEGRATDLHVDNGRWCELEIGEDALRVADWNLSPGWIDRVSFLG